MTHSHRNSHRTRAAAAFALLVAIFMLSGRDAAAAIVPRSLSAAEVREVRQTLESMKLDPRGPYLRIRWFCRDGTVQPPAGTPCRERGGGVQHAEVSPKTQRLAELGFQVGTILQALDFDQFFDRDNDHRLLKQLVLQDYLGQVDDGWVLREARFYRGARQIEDEERQGEAFLRQLLAQPDWVDRNFLLVFQLAATLPQPDWTAGSTERVRNLATEIANLDPNFQNLRSKIHSFPEATDIERVRAFLNSKSHPAETGGRLRELVATMEKQYDPARVVELIRRSARRLPQLEQPLTALIDQLEKGRHREAFLGMARLAEGLRRQIASEALDRDNLHRLNLLRVLLETAFGLPGEDSKRARETRLARIEVCGPYFQLAFAAGLLTDRELQAQRQELTEIREKAPALPALELRQHLAYLSRSLDWGQASIRQTFGPEFDQFLRVEPKVSGFMDSRVRGSILLPLSEVLSSLTQGVDESLNQSHVLWDQPISHGLRGLNPGVARAELSLAHQIDEPDPTKIYVIPDTVADLRPMAGILTLDAGNLLSHSQLLARNLGIPNASVSPALLPSLKALEGRQLFYAVSPLGRVVIRDPGRLEGFEKELIANITRNAPAKIDLDISRVQLQRVEPLPLKQLRLSDSGVVVGPKAANLGQLGALFPRQVAEGVALPFGMFHRHIDRPYEGKQKLTEEIRAAYDTSRRMAEAGRSQVEIDRFMFNRLDYFRRAILELPWLPDLRAMVERAVRNLPDYQKGVFVRSDTNAEDLPHFSGAGLNLTLPHRKNMESILGGIKRVWASPFSERAYLWRREILNSQEKIFCSVLLLRSVPSAESGVLITAGLEAGEADSLTVVTAEGVGGAVDGQSAETLSILPSGETKLLSSAKAPYRRVLSETSEGVEILPARRDQYLLNEAKIQQLQRAVQRWMATLSAQQRGLVWDIEFGFVDGKLWLFQIRPFVGHLNTRIMEVLREYDRDLLEAGQRKISLEEPSS